LPFEKATELPPEAKSRWEKAAKVYESGRKLMCMTSYDASLTQGFQANAPGISQQERLPKQSNQALTSM